MRKTGIVPALVAAISIATIGVTPLVAQEIATAATPAVDNLRPDGDKDRPDHRRRDHERHRPRDHRERPDRPDRRERPERPERPDRPDRPERPERPERPDHAQSGRRG